MVPRFAQQLSDSLDTFCTWPANASSRSSVPPSRMCSDGTYIYLLSSRFGLARMGTGQGGSVPGRCDMQVTP